MEAIKDLIKQPDKQEEEELIKRVKDVIDLWWEQFEKIKSWLPWRWRNIMRFSMLPKTPLHKKFDEVILKPDREKKREKESARIMWIMKNAKKEFIDEHFIEEWDYNLVKYKKISVREYKRNDENHKVLHIAIPYLAWNRTKFGYGLLISNIRTPKLFEDFITSMQQFKGDVDLVSNKQ